MNDLLLATAVLFAASAGIAIWQIRASKQNRKSQGLAAANKDKVRR
jgi:uncharacterized protein HemX